LEQVYSKRDAWRRPGYPFCEYLLVRRRGPIVRLEFMTITTCRSKNRRSLPLTWDNVTATECRKYAIRQVYSRRDACRRLCTCIKEKGGYFKRKLWHFNWSV